MLKSLLPSIALGGALLALAPAASAFQIDYENTYTNNWQEISSTYGSVPGLANVSYNDAQRGVNSFRYWSGNYSGSAAAFAGNADAGSLGQITLTPAAGYAITLNTFFLGSYANANRATSYYVDNLSTLGVDQTSGPITIGSAGLQVSPQLTSSQAIVIGFGPNAYNVGINHINFSVTAVPEPETYAMLLAGLGFIGAFARRRKQRDSLA